MDQRSLRKFQGADGSADRPPQFVGRRALLQRRDQQVAPPVIGSTVGPERAGVRRGCDHSRNPDGDGFLIQGLWREKQDYKLLTARFYLSRIFR